MPFVGVLFELEYAKTLPGEAVYILGSQPELGGWQLELSTAVQLQTNAFIYPRWKSLHPVWLKFDAASSGDLAVEYKYVMHCRAAEVAHMKWEEFQRNRRVAIPLEPDSLWLITDAEWGVKAQSSVRRTTMSEMRGRWRSFMPDWTIATTRRTPENYSLSPRAAMAQEQEFPIDEEFQALSPERACRFLPRSARVEDAHDDAHFGFSRCDSHSGEATWEELEALRSENAALRDALRTLVASPTAQVQLQLLDTPINCGKNTSPREPGRCGMEHVSRNDLRRVLEHRRREVDAKALYYASGAALDSGPKTPSPGGGSEGGRQHCGADGNWTPVRKAGGSIQEPQEEP